jgi:hypothetical protein
VIDDGVVGSEHSIGQSVVAHELPDILDRVQLGAFGWQGHDGDIERHSKALGRVPSGLVEQQHAVLARCNPGGDLRQGQAHGLGVAQRQHQTDGLRSSARGSPRGLFGKRGAITYHSKLVIS